MDNSSKKHATFLFWDFEEVDKEAPKEFYSRLKDSLGSSRLVDPNNIAVSRAFGPLTENTPELLKEMGFEHFETPPGDVAMLFMNLFLWLWDYERLNGTDVEIIVVLVTSNRGSLHFMNDLKKRRVHIILVSNGRDDALREMRLLADTNMNSNDMRSQPVASAASAIPYPTSVSASEYEPEHHPQALSEAVGAPSFFPREHTASSNKMFGDSTPIVHSGMASSHASGHATPNSVGLHSGYASPPSFIPGHRSNPHSGYASPHLTEEEAQYQSGHHASSADHHFYPQHRGGEQQPFGSHGMGNGSYSMRHPAMTLEDDLWYREMQSSFDTRNVRLAVATLRKIYPKQSRFIRIPDILIELLRNVTTNKLNPAQVDNNHLYVIFVLHCIQWCFGIRAKRKGETVDSFKYNMNKNLATWFLNSLRVTNMCNSTLVVHIKNSGEEVVKHILNSVSEFEFCVELLDSLGIDSENIRRILAPFVSMWQTCEVPLLCARTSSFAAKYNFNVNVNPLSSYGAPYSSLSSGMSTPGTRGNDSNPSSMTAVDDYNSFHYHDGSKGHYGSEQPASGTHSYKSTVHPLSQAAGTSAPQPPAHQQNEIDLDVLHTFMTHLEMQHNMDSNTLVDVRLFALLVSSVNGGLLKSRLLPLYCEVFGDPLDLNGRQLEDVLKISRNVDISSVTSHPNDKLFRVISPPGQDPLRAKAGGGPSGISPFEGGPSNYSSQPRAISSNQSTRNQCTDSNFGGSSYGLGGQGSGGSFAELNSNSNTVASSLHSTRASSPFVHSFIAPGPSNGFTASLPSGLSDGSSSLPPASTLPPVAIASLDSLDDDLNNPDTFSTGAPGLHGANPQYSWLFGAQS